MNAFEIMSRISLGRQYTCTDRQEIPVNSFHTENIKAKIVDTGRAVNMVHPKYVVNFLKQDYTIAIYPEFQVSAERWIIMMMSEAALVNGKQVQLLD